MMGNQQRSRRQTATRLFAREFYESSLPDGGQGEYDPRFIVTKLGARVNRMFVAGLIERLERRDTERGPMFSGAVRDPTGLHLWSVGSFRPELHIEMEELVARFEGGDRFLMACIGKSNHYTTEDGGFRCRMQMEDYAIIDREVYATWLVETANHTMRRIDALGKAQSAETTDSNALRDAGVPGDLIDGLGLAMNHYGDWDAEGYKVGVLQALSAAEGRVISFEEHEASSSASEEPVTENKDVEAESNDSSSPSVGDLDIETVVLEIIGEHAGAEGIDYDSIMKHCAQRGLSDEDSIEDVLYSLRDDKCEIMEPRFGWFKLM
jgi:RPA family protein